MKIIITAVSFLFLIATMNAQPMQSPVLFTIGNEKITKDEFVKVYQKTSPMNQADFSEKSLREYLDLYENFRLKVKESKDMHMDTTAAVLNEFKTYRSKLTSSYMLDTSVFHEAYNRLQTEVHVNHILLKLDPTASPADTLKAYKRVMNWRNLVTTGKIMFEQLAADSSGDPSVKDNKGDLGYITAMQVIYPFESAAYGMKAGEISKPVRTKFGYHLIRVVDTRPSRGTVTVAHLFIKIPANATDDDKAKAKAKIDSLYQRATEGEKWEDLVSKYSEDKTSAPNGGKLNSFGSGQMVPEFEEAAFALKNPGNISQPVKSKYGWHIIKLLEKKPIGSYADMKDDIKKKIENGPWKEHATSSFLMALKKQYSFTEFPDARKELFGKMDSTLRQGIWSDSMVANMNKPLFQLTDKQFVPEQRGFTQKDFADYIVKNQRKYLNKGTVDYIYNSLYDQFVNTSCTNFEDARLEAKYQPFKDLMEEYMNGILLFDLSSDKVWNKAVEDTAGLKAYYDQHKNNWMGQERASITTYTCKTQAVADELKKDHGKGMTDADILVKVNKKVKDNLVISNDEVEKGKDSEVEKLGWEAGKEYTVKGDSSVRIIKINQLLPAQPKPLSEVKGYVVAEYQEQLEKQWIASLKQKYPVMVNEQVFQSMVKK